MAVFPGPQDLGPVNPGSGERPIGQADASALARGGQALGAGLEQLGQGIESVNVARDRYQLRVNTAGALSQQIDLREALKHDTNYGPDASGQTLPQRYQTQAQQIRDAWAAKIDNPAMRELFTQSMNEHIQQGTSAVSDQAFHLQGQHDVAQLDQVHTGLVNNAVQANDHAALETAFRSYGDGVDSLVHQGVLGEDEGFRRKQQFVNGAAEAEVRHMMLTNSQGAQNVVRSAPGSDAELAEREINVESGGNPLARNPNSSASGLGGFIDSTWLSTLKAHRPDIANGRSDAELLALKADPNLSRQMVVASIQDNRQSLNAQGLDASAGNLYLAHFLGPGGAAKVLKASPDTPVAELLDPKVIAANRGVLAGKTAGTVIGWAANKMGGIAPGQGSLMSFVTPQIRAQLDAEATREVEKQSVQDLASFQLRRDNNNAEALSEGTVSQPAELPEYIAHYGYDRGPIEYQYDQIQIQKGRTIAGMARMLPEQRLATLHSLQPEPGDPNFAMKEKAFEVASDAADHLDKEFGVGKYAGSKEADPAGASISHLPASQQRYSDFSKILADPTATPDQRAQAAQTFAETTVLDQRHFGVPDGQQEVAPKSYVDALQKEISSAASSDDPQARLKVLGRIQSEAAMWGNKYWPQVLRQLEPDLQPITLAITHGMDQGAATRLLALDPKASTPEKLLAGVPPIMASPSSLSQAVGMLMQPLKAKTAGGNYAQDYLPYQAVATRLAALYVAQDNMIGGAAAAKAVKDVLGPSAGAAPVAASNGSALATSVAANGGIGAPKNTAPAAPAVGFVKDGWSFKGGDPSQPGSWAKVQ